MQATIDSDLIATKNVVIGNYRRSTLCRSVAEGTGRTVCDWYCQYWLPKPSSSNVRQCCRTASMEHSLSTDVKLLRSTDSFRRELKNIPVRLLFYLRTSFGRLTCTVMRPRSASRCALRSSFCHCSTVVDEFIYMHINTEPKTMRQYN